MSAPPTPLPHRRQFVIGPRPHLVRLDWRSLQLPCGAYLSHCPTLPVRAATDRDGIQWHLIGLAFQSGDGRPAPLAEIERSPTRAVGDLPRGWCGRFLLVGDGRAVPDFAALLSCFHARAGDGAIWASSSPVLLERALGVDPSPGSLTHGEGIDWYPPPATRSAAIDRLLPSQVLGLRDRAVHPRPLLLDLAARTAGDALDELQHRFTTTLRSIAGEHRTLWLPLTGGHDSRMLLAIAVAAGVPVKTYTHGKPASHWAEADRRLPPRLASTAAVPHLATRPRRLSGATLRAVDAHNGGYCAEFDRIYLARRQWAQVPEDAFVLRGGVFGVGKAHYHPKLPEQMPPSAGELLATVARAFGHGQLGQDDPYARGLAAWHAWCQSHPDPALDWRDRFYLEQRAAGWLAAVEQTLDLAPQERVHVANCEAIMAAFLALPAAERVSVRHQERLIGRTAPELLRAPFNPGDSRPYWVRRRLSRVWARAARTAGVGHPVESLMTV